MTIPRPCLLALVLLLGGCLTWVDPALLDDDDSGDDDDDLGDDDSAGDDDTAGDDDSAGDDDDSTPDPDADGDGFTPEDGDCDDADPLVHPAADELCNGLDDNCDGVADEDLPTQLYAPDADGDGYPTSNTDLHVSTCTQPDGFLPVSGQTLDCADSNATIYPNASEVCNGLDDNCDGQPDDGVQVPLYLDQDQDGWGGGAVVGNGCPGPGYATTGEDCDDGNANLTPGDDDGDGITSCDGDCDDTNANVAPGTDFDNDGFQGCSDDCDDTDGNINPIAAESCNGVDDNCDGQVDEGLNSVVVIHGVDVANADAIDALLGGAGYCMGPAIDVADLWSVASLPYSAIVVTDDAGDSSGVFGDFNVVWSWWNTSGSGTSSSGALVAMGEGGLAALGWLGVHSDLQWSNAFTAAGSWLYVRTPGQPVYTTPNPINPAAGSVLTLTSAAGAQNVMLNSVSGITALGWGNQVLGDVSFVHAPPSGTGALKDAWLWGNTGSMAQASVTANQLFENLISASIGPP